jgi:hypothetical protein
MNAPTGQRSCDVRAARAAHSYAIEVRGWIRSQLGRQAVKVEGPLLVPFHRRRPLERVLLRPAPRPFLADQVTAADLVTSKDVADLMQRGPVRYPRPNWRNLHQPRVRPRKRSIAIATPIPCGPVYGVTMGDRMVLQQIDDVLAHFFNIGAVRHRSAKATSATISKARTARPSGDPHGPAGQAVCSRSNKAPILAVRPSFAGLEVQRSPKRPCAPWTRWLRSC